MKCPHCLVEIHGASHVQAIGQDIDGKWFLTRILCPACERFILALVSGKGTNDDLRGTEVWGVETEYLIRPKAAFRTPPATM